MRRIVIHQTGEVPMTMWWKIAAGAALGFVIGSFAPPGYPLWVTVGVLAGAGAALRLQRRAARAGGPGDGTPDRPRTERGGGGAGTAEVQRAPADRDRQ